MQVVLRTWLENYTLDNKGSAVKSALQMDWWRPSALEVLPSLNADQLADVSEPPPEIITQAARIYKTATNWNDANHLAARVAIPFADRYSPADINLVLEASNKGADMRGSHGFNEFIALLYDKNPITTDDLEALMDKHDLQAYKRAPQVASN